MEKLTIEQLAPEHLIPYLGTGLKVNSNHSGKLIDNGEMLGICKIKGIHVADKKQDYWTLPLFIQPILHDLSSLVRPIIVEGYDNNKPFVPIEYFEIGDDNNESIEYDSGNIKLIRSLESLAKSGIVNHIKYLPYGVVQQLYKWHFNVFNIPSHLFIDKLNLK